MSITKQQHELIGSLLITGLIITIGFLPIGWVWKILVWIIILLSAWNKQ